MGLFSRKKAEPEGGAMPGDNGAQQQQYHQYEAPAQAQPAPVHTAVSGAYVQPQWTSSSPTHQQGAPAHGQNNSTASAGATRGEAETGAAATQYAPVAEICTQCQNNRKKDCKCTVCYVCQAGIGMGKRHHCRVCWQPVCSACRDHKRVDLNPNAAVNELLTCDNCSIRAGIASLNHENMQHRGLYALIAAAEPQRRCIASDCGAIGFKVQCLRCKMPTVSIEPHAPKTVLPTMCCKESDKKRCGTCFELLGRLKVEEDTAHALENSDFEQISNHWLALQQQDPEQAEAYLRGFYGGPIPQLAGMTPREARLALLGVVGAGLAYEYPAYPHITKSKLDIPCARLIKILSSSQRITLAEAVGKVLLVCIPGTHDPRTAITDAKFFRVRETEGSFVHGGLSYNPRTGTMDVLNSGACRMWDYKMHSGFATDEKMIELPSNLDEFYRQGYTVVYCGHSLGGALCSLLMLRVLKQMPQMAAKQSLCVTMGAPLVGNSGLHDRIHSCGWGHLFHHLVYRGDVVPRMLISRQLITNTARNITDTARNIKKDVRQLKSRFFSFVRKVRGGNAAEQDDDEVAATTVAQDPEMEMAHNLDEAVSEANEIEELAASKIMNMANDVGAEIGNGVTLFKAKKMTFCPFGRHHLLHPDVNTRYKTTPRAEESFDALKEGHGNSGMLNCSVFDHVMASYNKAICHLQHSTL